MRIAGDDRFEIRSLTAEDAAGWALMPFAMYRIAQFVKNYDSDADPAMMLAHLKLEFSNPKPRMLVLVLLEDGAMRGHLLAGIEEWFGSRFATVVQYETDTPVPLDLTREAFGAVEEWGKSHGCKAMRAITRNAALARTFGRYGFSGERVIITKPLPTGVADETANG
jgi:hypothetical protein